MFICTVHSGLGSMAEAMDPQYVFGPFADRKIAKGAAEQFARECDENDWLVNIISIPDPPVDVAAVIASWKRDNEY